MARAANLIVALSARNGMYVASSCPVRKHIAIVGSTTHLRSSKSCKFEQIMGRADQHPFVFNLVQPAQQELSEAACLLDLPKHRFDRLLAQPIRAVDSPGRQSSGPWPRAGCPPWLVAAAGAAVPCFCRPAAI